jgi:hypothetical protein
MELIMATKLKVRKECYGQSVHFDYEGSSKNVYLDDETPQEQLQMVSFLGIDVFEKDEKVKEVKESK